MRNRVSSSVGLVLAGLTAALLAGCTGEDLVDVRAKALQPIPAKLVSLMGEKEMTARSPIMVRAYKQESELEIWKQRKDGQYALLKTYPICRWSGQLGPKLVEGDRQAPEGFYEITPGLMNPNSQYYLAFNVGYPNEYDRSFRRTGGAVMVHGACSSRGCFSMTDEQVGEIYAMAREAFAGGQRSFQFQAYPFRMTPENFAKFRKDKNLPFWKNLKEGHDHTLVAGRPPSISVCAGQYVFNRACDEPEGDIAAAVAAKTAKDEAKVAALVSAGTPAIRVVYRDGDSHPAFSGLSARLTSTGDSERLSPVVEQTFGKRRIAGLDVPHSQVTPPTIITLDDRGNPLAGTTAVAQTTAGPTTTAVAAAPAPSGGLLAQLGLLGGSGSGGLTGSTASAAPTGALAFADVPLPRPSPLRQPGAAPEAKPASVGWPVASAPRAAVPAAAPSAERKPFYERWFSMLSPAPTSLSR